MARSRPSPTATPPPADALLLLVGERVRRRRLDLHLSQRALAERSGVSARYLAQVETGGGNPSLRVLERLARALTVAPADLLASLPAPRRTVIALLGLRGAGKSTIGKRLAGRLGLPFLELDDLIEEAAGMRLGPIFEMHGEDYFRRLERQALNRVLERGASAVLATGGGIVTDPESFERLRASCLTVWISAHPEHHYERVLAQGDRRPMTGKPDAMANLKALLEARAPLYRQAMLTVDTSACGVDEAIERITAAVRRAGGPVPAAAPGPR